MPLGRDEEPLGHGARRLELELPRPLEVGGVDDRHVGVQNVVEADQVGDSTFGVYRGEVVDLVDHAGNLSTAWRVTAWQGRGGMLGRRER